MYQVPTESAYIFLSTKQNGGIPTKTKHRTLTPTSWSDDCIAISGIYSIGNVKRHSLLGELQSSFWAEEWGYPSIGIYFADCPSGGHDLLCQDYRDCGPKGEPRVVHVDQEFDYQVTHVADTFESFIRGLEVDDEPA